jgi:hypothetical protein
LGCLARAVLLFDDAVGGGAGGGVVNCFVDRRKGWSAYVLGPERAGFVVEGVPLWRVYAVWSARLDDGNGRLE